MARHDLDHDVHDHDELDDEQTDDGREDGVAVMASGMPAWFISAAVHLVVLFIFSLIVFISKELEEEAPPVHITQIEPPPKVDKPEAEPEIKPNELHLDVDVAAVDKPSPLTDLNVPIETYDRADEVIAETPRGTEDAISDSAMGGSGLLMTIGVGPGGKGIFGKRTGGRRNAACTLGGNAGSENAVERALRWFKKHQSPNGEWNPLSYPNNCADQAKCEPGSGNYAGGTANVAATGYALLCYFGAGYDQRMPSIYKPTVQKGIEFLKSVQKPDGAWGDRNYENGVATMAMAEAYAMSGDQSLKEPTQKAVNVILQRQNIDPAGAAPYNGLGWDYVGPDGRNDSSVTGWQVMALKSAAAAGLNVGNGMEGAKIWLKKTWEATNPDFAKLDRYGESKFTYCWATGAPGPGGHTEMAPVGALCAVFLGRKQGDVLLETLCNYISNHQLPTKYPTNTYYLYYNTLAIFQQGDHFEKWNNSVRDLLVKAQRRSQDCFDGSWDWEGTEFPGYQVGRLFSTAYCCLSLEVYYRYDKVDAKAK